MGVHGAAEQDDGGVISAVRAGVLPQFVDALVQHIPFPGLSGVGGYTFFWGGFVR